MIFILILINIVFINTEILASNNGRNRFYPCSQGQRLTSIEKCIENKYSEEEKCINCATKDSYTCQICINEIFNELNLVNGELICSINELLQEKVCQMHCREKLKTKSKRDRNEIPKCSRQTNKETTIKYF
jgi:hypothetical protein